MISYKMKKHTKIYFDYFNYDICDFVPCETCGSKAVDIHHIDARGMGGSDKDNIENLMALCRNCHIKYGDIKDKKEWLKELHKYNLCR
jgi:5-methylcytosine-specific restriction endonuclease McrA